MALKIQIVLLVKVLYYGYIANNVSVHAQMVTTEMNSQYVKLVVQPVKHAHGLEPRNVLLVMKDSINNHQ